MRLKIWPNTLYDLDNEWLTYGDIKLTVKSRNWTELIGFQADSIHQLTIEKCGDILDENLSLSLTFGELIDSILNQVASQHMEEGQIFHIVRNDPVEREWEATFSTVHMADAPITRLICEGFYLQAIVLLRQQLEGMSQLQHILDRSRDRNFNRAPKVGNLPESIRSLYQELSQGAHLATHNLASIQAPFATTDDNLFALLPYQHSIIPKFNQEVADTLLRVHVEHRRELLARFKLYISRLSK